MGVAGTDRGQNQGGIPIPFTWYDSSGTLATDLSVDQHTQWVEWPAWATGALIAWGNTGTGSPVGARELHICNHGDETATTYDLYPGASPGSIAGVADHVNLKISKIARFARLFYNAASGGTGAVFTDDSQQAGGATSITFF
jgi:hypothetical protein